MSQENSVNKNNPERRMGPDYPFQFQCSPGVSCFTECCQDVTIALTPYDVMRLKNRLGIPSDEFLDKYTIVLRKEKQLLPFVILKMDDATKKCLLVSPDGCKVYGDRPWPCRMFPLDMGADGSYHVITGASKCEGLSEKQVSRISDWLEEQGIGPYDEMNELLTQLTTMLQVQKLDIDNPQIAQMIFMALYNLDKFKEFVFKSSFLDRFELEEPDKIEKIKNDDLELLKFAFDWLKFGLFGEKLFWVKEQPNQ